jgi:uncharacterized protein YegP (UPF0339 family)
MKLKEKEMIKDTKVLDAGNSLHVNGTRDGMRINLAMINTDLGVLANAFSRIADQDIPIAGYTVDFFGVENGQYNRSVFEQWIQSRSIECITDVSSGELTLQVWYTTIDGLRIRESELYSSREEAEIAAESIAEETIKKHENAIAAIQKTVEECKEKGYSRKVVRHTKTQD